LLRAGHESAAGYPNETRPARPAIRKADSGSRAVLH
jgi:hypothetical protein